MNLIFTLDSRGRWVALSPEMTELIPKHLSWPKRLWAKAKARFLSLPFRFLSEDKIFIRGNRERGPLVVYHSPLQSQRIDLHWRHFLRRRKIRRLFYLLVEILLLPVSGLAALLPGPNVFFGVLALLIITHWQSLSGLRQLSRLQPRFEARESLANWEKAIRQGKLEAETLLIEQIESEFGLERARKILLPG